MGRAKWAKHQLQTQTGLTFGFWCVGSDGVEDVDEHEEESDEESHAAGDHVGRHNETDPGDDNEQA